MNQFRICDVNEFQVYNLWRKKHLSNHLVPSVSLFRPCVNWQLVGSSGHSALGCLKQFVPRPTMGLSQNGFPDS